MKPALPSTTPARHIPHSDGFSTGTASGGVATVTVAVFGCECAEVPSDFETRARAAFAAADGPAAIHAGRGEHPTGRRFVLVIGYWLDHGRFGRWQSAHGWPRWCAADAAQASAQGYWREIFSVPAARLETLLSAADIRHGLSACGLPVIGPVMEHGYWGSMRDRIADAAQPGDATPVAHGVHPADHGEWGVSTVIRPPAGLCVICSGQDWSRCTPEHASFHQQQLRPKLAVAMDSLRRDAHLYDCLSLRTVELHDESGSSRAAGFVLAMFRQLEGLERWARTDPDHLAIFGAFIAHKRATQTALRLWHEVLLLPSASEAPAHFEYLRCAPPAGLLNTGSPTIRADQEESP